MRSPKINKQANKPQKKGGKNQTNKQEQKQTKNIKNHL